MASSLDMPAFLAEAFPLDNCSTGIDDHDFSTDGKLSGLGVVDRTLFESWKELPWQARLCPKAVEEQEDTRRDLAQEKEVNNLGPAKAERFDRQVLGTT